MKLEIPDPDEPAGRDDTELCFELWLGIALSTLIIFFGWFLWVAPQDDDQQEPFAHIADQQQRQTLQDRAEFEEMAERDATDWSEHRPRLGRIFEVGPREATEAACTQFEDTIADEAAPRSVLRPLRQGVNRRSEDIPWSCLTRLFLDQRLADDSELGREFASFWRDVEALDADPRRVISILQKLRDDPLPDSERFIQWLARCALSMDFMPAPICQEIARDRASQYGFGRDILEMLLHHIGRPEGAADSDQYATDLEIAADALSWFARQGQPPGWKIEETAALPDYDVDFRIGAVFQLCRLLNAPNEEVQTFAAEGLSRVANVTIRANDENMKYRWHRSCRLAFGDLDDPHQQVPVLGVSLREDDQLVVDYGIDTLVEVGICESEQDYPSWFCGAERWTGGSTQIHRFMSRKFAEAGYVEWYEPEQLADVVEP